MASKLMIATWKKDRAAKKKFYDELAKQLKDKALPTKKRNEVTTQMTDLAKEIDKIDRKIENGEED